MNTIMKRGLTVKEYNELNRILTTVNRFSRKLAQTPSDKWEPIEKEIESASEQYDKRIYELVAACYSLEASQMENLENKVFMEMFDRLYRDSSYVPKNSNEPSQSTSSSITPTPPATQG